MVQLILWVLEASSLLQPYWVTSTLGWWDDNADLQIAAWRWALLTSCANAAIVGIRHFRSGADVTRFLTSFLPQFHSNIRRNLLLWPVALCHEHWRESSLWDHFCQWNVQVPKLVKTVFGFRCLKADSSPILNSCATVSQPDKQCMTGKLATTPESSFAVSAMSMTVRSLYQLISL